MHSPDFDVPHGKLKRERMAVDTFFAKYMQKSKVFERVCYQSERLFQYWHSHNILQFIKFIQDSL